MNKEKSSPPISGILPAHDCPLSTSQEILAVWTAYVASGSTENTLELYTKDALFFGSNPRLHIGHCGIKAYFDEVNEGYLQNAVFHEQHAYFVQPNIIAFSSYVDFTLFENNITEVQYYRITFCFKRTDEGWKIAHQHASRILEIEKRAVVPARK